MILDLEKFLNYIPTKKTFVLIGETLSYSISKDIHTRIFEQFDIDADYFYLELKDESETESAFNHLKKYFGGANVTIPYKTSFFKYLDEIDEEAERLGSVNTIKFENGTSKGYNTDILGIKDSLKLDNIDLTNKNIAVLGNGGTASVVCDILASNNCDITVFSRNPANATHLLEKIRKSYADIDIKSANIAEFKDNFYAIFNTTPVGMSKFEGVSPINEITESEYIFDCAYNPLQTKLLHIAEKEDKIYRNGLNMLIKQALFAEQIWNDIDVLKSNNIEQSFMVDILNKRTNGKNIIIYGYMGCGKTTISKELSEITGIPFVDTDDLIIEKEKMSVSEIFEKYGEAHFRKDELEIATKLATSSNKIISVGGGFVMNDEVVDVLRNSSTFVFLNTSLDQIKQNLLNDTSRPLLKNNNIDELYNKRYDKYLSISDVVIEKEQSPNKKALDIISKI